MVYVTPFLGSVNLLEWLTELRETLMFSSLLKDVIKDTDEQLDEELHRKRSRSNPSTGASVPLKLGCIILPDVFFNLEAFQITYYWGFYGGFIT